MYITTTNHHLLPPQPTTTTAATTTTVPFHSIRHPMWRMTCLTKFWFRQPPKLAVTHWDFRQVFDSLAPQAMNFIYIWHMIIKWIRHRTKFSVTTVTFRHFGGPCDTWLTNWLKWYSTCYHHNPLPPQPLPPLLTTIITHYHHNHYSTEMNALSLAQENIINLHKSKGCTKIHKSQNPTKYTFVLVR